MTFAYLVRDSLIHGVWGVINESRASFVRVIVNTENWYVIYLLLIICIQIKVNLMLMESVDREIEKEERKN